jgi:hypothetical protein
MKEIYVMRTDVLARTFDTMKLNLILATEELHKKYPLSYLTVIMDNEGIAGLKAEYMKFKYNVRH